MADAAEARIVETVSRLIEGVAANDSMWIELSPAGSGRTLDGAWFRVQALRWRVV